MTRLDDDADKGGKARVKLSDVAARAGVGRSIASRVLNGDPTVSTRPETRHRIIAAARELNYTPNAIARGLKLARTNTLGLVLPNLAYAVNAEIIQGAERRAAAEGYVVLVADGDEFSREGTPYRQLLLEGRVDGLLVASATTSDQVLSAILSQRVPCVLVNRRGHGLPQSVSLDDAAGIRLALEHLAGLGHTRVAHVAGPHETDTGGRRAAGFREAAHALALDETATPVVEESFSEEGGYASIARLLALPEPPTAIVFASLAAAIGGIAGIVAAGLRVPEDMSIVGFHDAPIAAYLNPPLTTVRMALREMAEQAVDLLVRQIEGVEVASVVVTTEPVLVERGSTRAPESAAPSA